MQIKTHKKAACSTHGKENWLWEEGKRTGREGSGNSQAPLRVSSQKLI